MVIGDNNVKVLIACNIDASGRGNPFEYQFLKSLVKRDELGSVQHGTEWLYEDDIPFDLIHFHWPEELVNWQEPTTKGLQKISEALDRWKSKEVAMVATIHNEYPHYKDTTHSRDLYDLIYSHTDGFIHMGNASKKVMRLRYGEYLSRGIEEVIPHGDYSWFPNKVDQEQAKRFLELPSESQVILSFGSIRSPEEIDLLHMVSRNIINRETKLLIAGRFPVKSRGKITYYTSRFPFWVNSDVLLADHFVPSNEVQNYLNAADVLLIPRKKVLNSGNLALGFTFGKIVVGPDTGNVGEILKTTGNPIFEPTSSESIINALKEGLELPKDYMRKNNQQYARKYMNWEAIGKMHVEFYRKVLKN